MDKATVMGYVLSKLLIGIVQRPIVVICDIGNARHAAAHAVKCPIRTCCKLLNPLQPLNDSVKTGNRASGITACCDL
jgi:hypothetical protein